MPAQRQDTAARPADVAEQKLQDRGCANDLNAFRMLRPPERITNRGGFIGTRGGDECLRNFFETGPAKCRKSPPSRGYIEEMAPQRLESRLRMLQGRIALRETGSLALVSQLSLS